MFIGFHLLYGVFLNLRNVPTDGCAKNGNFLGARQPSRGNLLDILPAHAIMKVRKRALPIDGLLPHDYKEVTAKLGSWAVTSFFILILNKNLSYQLGLLAQYCVIVTCHTQSMAALRCLVLHQYPCAADSIFLSRKSIKSTSSATIPPGLPGGIRLVETAGLEPVTSCRNTKIPIFSRPRRRPPAMKKTPFPLGKGVFSFVLTLSR